ncbi:MAG: hypothetical protein VYD53_11340 [Pseudomonadota bacterium]|nr:hypothetical protein [Pseudomonadota bacterium]
MTKQHKAMNTNSEHHLALFKMQTEYGLIESMLRSKTLSAMVIVGGVLFAAFGYFLYRMAGA